VQSVAPDRWAVAIPGPFDYVNGIGGVHPRGKLAALTGVDLRNALAPLLGTDRIVFINDATAFGLGSALDHPGHRRLLALTFGSGIGSVFVEDSRVVLDERVPRGGEIYHLPTGPDEATIESRYGPAALAAAQGFASFHELAEHARNNPHAAARLRADVTALADALAPWLGSFAPDLVVCGGGACHAWDLFGAALSRRIAEHAGTAVRVVACPDTEKVALRGAAAVAMAT
jgi:glucokinase